MDQNNNQKKYPTQLMLYARLLVGGYLYYTVYSLISGGGIKEAQGLSKVFFIVAAVAFVVIGGILMVISAKALLEGRYEGGKMDTASAQTQTTDEVIVDEEENFK